MPAEKSLRSWTDKLRLESENKGMLSSPDYTVDINKRTVHQVRDDNYSGWRDETPAALHGSNPIFTGEEMDNGR